ncbi:MAG: hypothetical protein ACI9CO_002480 [Candidatus Azotimanducaceae bacterium]|jgi:hypothetical protein
MKTIATFNVTRDGWYNLGETDDGYHLLNRTFESGNANQDLYNLQSIEEYPTGSGANAYKLTRTDENDNQVNKVPAKPLATNVSDSGEAIDDGRTDNNVATGVMIHISGNYEVTSWGGDWDWLGGSYGCFGFIPEDDIFANAEAAAKASANDLYDDKSSNANWNAMTKTINNLRAESGYIKFQLVVKARNNVVSEKNVEKKEILSE